MKWSLAFLALPIVVLADQVPFQLVTESASDAEYTYTNLRHKSKILTVEEFIEVSRPGAGVANDKGDLVLVPVSKYSMEERK